VYFYTQLFTKQPLTYTQKKIKLNKKKKALQKAEKGALVFFSFRLLLSKHLPFPHFFSLIFFFFFFSLNSLHSSPKYQFSQISTSHPSKTLSTSTNLSLLFISEIPLLHIIFWVSLINPTKIKKSVLSLSVSLYIYST